jgi:lipid-A-disaccharide synthase
LSSQRQILIVAGESSGDLHGSHLISATLERYPEVSFAGVGGQRMEQAGCRILFPAEELSVMGVVEVVRHLPRIFRRFAQLKKVLAADQPPDLLVLIDFPDFNLRLAKVAKKHGVAVLYYISPKIWAWRPGRARVIAERVDRLALIFPFEPQIYAPFKVQAEYVGNPLLDEFAARTPARNLRSSLDLSDTAEIIGIFPGSRQSELRNIFATLLETAERLHAQRPDAVFVMPVAPSLSRSDLEQRLADSALPLHLIEGHIYDVAALCDAVVTVSGTVTLQLALTGTPMAVVYKVAPLSYAIGRRLIRIPFAGLPNIVAGRQVVREFIQDAADPLALCAEIARILDDPVYAGQIRAGLAEVRRQLGAPGCSLRVAEMIAEMTGLPPRKEASSW